MDETVPSKEKSNKMKQKQRDNPAKKYYIDLLTQEEIINQVNFFDSVMYMKDWLTLITKKLLKLSVQTISKCLLLLSWEKNKRAISISELSFVLKTHNNIASGSTGFMGALYKVLWRILNKIILEAINCFKKDNILPPFKRYGVIAIILNIEKHLLYIQNWIPLTLLNSPYKIISSVFTQRLKCVLSRIICSHQKAYVPGH